MPPFKDGKQRLAKRATMGPIPDQHCTRVEGNLSELTSKGHFVDHPSLQADVATANLATAPSPMD